MSHKDHYRNGNKLVSVTELLTIVNKPFLEKWKESLCSFQNGQCGFERSKQIAEEAAGLGNEVHEQVAYYLTHSSYAPAIHLQDKWSHRVIDKLNELNVKKYLIEPEQNLIDEESGLAGSPDFVGTFPDPCMSSQTQVIGDLKIKNQLDSLTALQGVGYRYLIKRLYKVDINTMLVIWAQKKSKTMNVKDVWINLDDWQKEWKALVCLWNKLNPKRCVRIYE